MAFKSPYRGNVGLRQWREFAYGGLAETYVDKVIATGPLVYFPQAEVAGLVSTEVINGWDGAYTGVTLNDPAGQPSIDGEPVGRYDGINDIDDLFTAQLAAAFNGAEGTMAFWLRMLNIGVWTDTVVRVAGRIRSTVAGSVVDIRKSAGNNRLEFLYNAGGVGGTRVVAPFNSVVWFHCTLTWSAIANQAIAYIDGAQQGAVIAPVGVWAGVPINTGTLVGAFNNVPVFVTNGWIAHTAIWTRPLTPAEVLEVATP